MSRVQHELFQADTEVFSIPITVEDAPTGPVAVPPDRLVCVAGVELGRTFVIESDALVVGRGSPGIDLQSAEVSRRHARVWRSAGAAFVEDLGSSNGTLVNGVQIRAKTQLQLGDRVQFGSTIFVYTRHDELEERLQQLKKLDAMGALVKGLAHDFNNTLTVLLAGLDEVRERWLIDDPEARRTLADMNQATESAAALVRRLLRIGRAKPPTSELVSVSVAVERAVVLARRLKLDRISLSHDIPAEAVTRGSYEELEQVFLNLILNARDAMPDGGEIAITGTMRTLDRTRALSLHLETEGTFIEISVADTGCGMNEATLARIFEPFFTTKPRGKGTGLGLAMVYSTVRNCQGVIHAESAPGRGTTLRILLPSLG